MTHILGALVLLCSLFIFAKIRLILANKTLHRYRFQLIGSQMHLWNRYTSVLHELTLQGGLVVSEGVVKLRRLRLHLLTLQLSQQALQHHFIFKIKHFNQIFIALDFLDQFQKIWIVIECNKVLTNLLHALRHRLLQLSPRLHILLLLSHQLLRAPLPSLAQSARKLRINYLSRVNDLAEVIADLVNCFKSEQRIGLLEVWALFR